MVREGWSWTRTDFLEECEGQEGWGRGECILSSSSSPFKERDEVGLQVFFLQHFLHTLALCIYSEKKDFLPQKDFGRHGRFSSMQSRQELCLHEIFEVQRDKIN